MKKNSHLVVFAFEDEDEKEFFLHSMVYGLGENFVDMHEISHDVYEVDVIDEIFEDWLDRPEPRWPR